MSPDDQHPTPFDRGAAERLAAFSSIADQLKASIGPRKVLVLGRAAGALVEALRERGFVALGLDPSGYVLDELCQDTLLAPGASPVVNPFADVYDLIMCIGVFARMREGERRVAIANMCRSSGDVLVSSTIDGAEEPAQTGGCAPSFWVEQFAEHGFYVDLDFDARFIAADAVRFRKGGSTCSPLHALRVQPDCLQSELAALPRTELKRDQLVADLTHRLWSAQQTIGWQFLERLRPVRDRLFPLGSRRRIGYWTARRVAEIFLNGGMRTLVTSLARTARCALKGEGILIKAPPVPIPPGPNWQYEVWLRSHKLTAQDRARMEASLARFAETPLLTILTPAYNTDASWLRKAIDSVRTQVYPFWELCLANDASTEPHVKGILDEYAAKDSRIRVTHLPRREGVGEALNQALRLATGKYVCALGSDDELSPDALFELVKRLNEEPDLDVLYADQDKLELDGSRVEPFFKPDWSPDLFLSLDYLSGFALIRRTLIEEVGGFKRRWAQIFDLLLRVTEKTNRIAHVPMILYHWRKVPGSLAASTLSKPFALDAGRGAIEDALKRRGCDGWVESVWPGIYAVRYRLRGTPLVSIIIPVKDRWELLQECINSLKAKTAYQRFEIIVLDHDSREPETREYLDAISRECRVYRRPGPFNFSAANNFGAARAQGEHLLFLNNDTRVIRADWLTAMLEHAQRPEVGAVGARLIYPDGRIQHAGVTLGIGGVAGHAFRGIPDRFGYFGFAVVARNCSAVTGACMLVPRRKFEEVGGFDERLKVVFNDVDLCLRLRQRDYLIVYSPATLLYHYESATRGGFHPKDDEEFFMARWGDLIRRGDPYYNPNLTLSREDWSLRL